MTMTQTPIEANFFSLTKRKDRVNPRDVQGIFDRLPAVSPVFIFGEWGAHLLATGHPSDQKAAALLPVFKAFRSHTSVVKYSLEGSEKKHLPGWGNMFALSFFLLFLQDYVLNWGSSPFPTYTLVMGLLYWDAHFALDTVV
ncbi:hypothetical protein M747DRAFT_309065 [Aspergillus niger ATCC 13496]|uniref:GXWXG domain-containing protein n=1 Tax=Aspergillus niger ATCC 13496 TaxID=1353008 RepID=A0A370BLR6_ASPNG|nr:hypothetical protein M747DRAFT_309065 [Aspergillus niger ATCC 13496]